jgi:hypothetical protein
MRVEERAVGEGEGVAFEALTLKTRDLTSEGAARLPKKMRHCHVKEDSPVAQRESKTVSKGAGNGSHCPGIWHCAVKS